MEKEKIIVSEKILFPKIDLQLEAEKYLKDKYPQRYKDYFKEKQYLWLSLYRYAKMFGFDKGYQYVLQI